ncbi:MAG: ATP-binding cassette domain-containing protein [Lachnospiraceae bacterium]|nr:ATP-binding cassette domain-containing protein [Lachnospiraceae bacterium]
MRQGNEQEAEGMLLVITPDGKVRDYHLQQMGKRIISIGRDSTNDIVLESGKVSHEHGQLIVEQNKIMYQDKQSSNGTYIDILRNKKYLHHSDAVIQLNDGMVMNIGGEGKKESVYMLYSVFLPNEGWQKISINRKQLTMGRASNNDIVLAHPAISRLHASIEPSEQGYELVNNSKNGVLLNGRVIQDKAVLKECDIIQILAFQMIYLNGSIFYKTNSDGISLTVQHLGKTVGGGRKTLLHDVNLQIESNEFVAIIGGSGAGKTTLMNAISGFDRKITGQVYCNGLDLLSNFKYLKAIIGYVPQEDIIYQNLTLRKMLEYTAKLKMPDDVTKQERNRQIENVLEMVELKPQENTYIRKLSGGQKKRASIAVELLADPRLFFLDEPTSGLDPGTEQNLMRTLNRLSKTQKKTIIMVTHTIQNLDLCDRIILMGTGGRCCFNGTYEEAKMFFDTQNLADAYNTVTADSTTWEKEFNKFQKKDYEVEMQSEQIKNDMKASVRRSSALRQWFILMQRYMELIRNDRMRLVILMLQPIIIGGMLYLVADDSVFDVYENTKTMLFALCCSGIWIGLFNSIQEICKERNILRREYMTNLKLPVYVMSKFVVQALIGLIQTVLLSGTFILATGKERTGVFMDSFVPEIILTIWLVVIASEAMGLLVSANAKSGDKAMVAAPFLLIIQLLFSGILFKLKGAGEYISYLTVSRWTVESLGGIADLNSLPLKLQADYPMIEHEAEAFFEATGDHVLHCWGILGIMIVAYLVLSIISLSRLSEDSR